MAAQRRARSLPKTFRASSTSGSYCRYWNDSNISAPSAITLGIASFFSTSTPL